MDGLKIEYKGYVITPTLSHDDAGKCYGGYSIVKDGNVVSTRGNIFPGFFYVDAARGDSVEHAKLEIDNWAT